MDSDKSGGRSKLDFSDIMSMLEEGEQKKPEPKPVKKTEAPKEPRDNVFAQKLLADIEHKNVEILKLSSDNMSLKYALSEKEMEIKKLRSLVESLNGQIDGLKAQVTGLNQQVEDLNKNVNDAHIKLGEMDADRAKLTARIIKNEGEVVPSSEEDVASIFKRISSHDELAGEAVDGADRLQKKQKTAKLYDL